MNPDRRGFLKALLYSAGGAAVVALPGCGAVADASPAGAGEWTGPVQAMTAPTRVQPGLRYANTMPSRIPSVRWIETDGVVDNSGTTKQ
jgi:hypothetical protein